MGKRLPTLTSPIVEWNWPWINVRKTKFKAEGEFTVDMIFDSPEDPFLKKVEALIAEGAEDAIKDAVKEKQLKPAHVKNVKTVLPWKAEEDEQGEETGRVVWTIKTDAVITVRKTGKKTERTVKVFDASTPPKDITDKKLKIASGTKGRVAFSYKIQFVKITGNIHFTTYLNAVQIVELCEFGADAGSYGFSGEEGGFDGADVPDYVPVEDTLDTGDATPVDDDDQVF